MKLGKYLLFITFLLAYACACSTNTEIVVPQITHQKNTIQITKKVYVDEKFTTEERQLIQSAALKWEEATNKIITFDLVYNFKLDIKRPNSAYEYYNKIILSKNSKNDDIIKMIEDAINEEVLLMDDDDKIHILGYTLKKSNFEVLFIVSDRMTNSNGKLNSARFENVVMHEIGHELGMMHFDDGPSVMNSEFEKYMEIITNSKHDPITCLTDFDALQFCGMYFCKPEEIKTCR